MASLKKVLRNAWLGKRYAVIEGKENKAYADTPTTKRTQTFHVGLSERKPNTTMDRRPALRRNTSITQSVRDVVGSFRQKLKKPTKQRKRLQDSPSTTGFRKKTESNKKTPTRRGGYRAVKMYSPFSFSTPDRSQDACRRRDPIKWFDYETPSKLRKEVEDLTANMQAMVALTPRTLQSRASRRSLVNSPSPITNGSLKTPNSSRRTPQARKRIPTTEL